MSGLHDLLSQARSGLLSRRNLFGLTLVSIAVVFRMPRRSLLTTLDNVSEGSLGVVVQVMVTTQRWIRSLTSRSFRAAVFLLRTGNPDR